MRPQEHELALPARTLLKKTNLNNIAIQCGEPYSSDVMEKIDSLIFPSTTDIKPVVFRTVSDTCSDMAEAQCFPLATRILALQAPTLGVIDAYISIYSLIPILFCSRRVMYENATVYIDVVYNKSWAPHVHDMFENTMKVVGIMKDILRKRTALPESVIDSIEKQRSFFTPKMCLQYKIVDEVIKMNVRVA